MRKMYIMRGAPASGKSTLISTLGAEHLSTGRDKARDFIRGFTICGDAEGQEHTTRVAPATAEAEISELVHKSVLSRLRQGQTIFLDTTASRHKDISQWIPVAARFGYEVVVVDCQGDLTDEELLARNARRPEHQRVTPEVVTAIAALCRNPLPKGVRVIPGTVGALVDDLSLTIRDYNHYDRLIAIGDVQGCNTALQDLLAEVEYNPATDRLIFLGDLFDRGVENADVFRTMQSLDADRIDGNHDRNLRYVVNNAIPHGMAATRVTLEELRAAGITNEEIHALLDLNVRAMAATFGGTEFWFTHGGVLGLGTATAEGYLTGLVPQSYLWYGAGRVEKTYLDKGDYGYNIDAAFQAKVDAEDRNLVQFHGHRNHPDVRPGDYPACVSLETEVEFDGGHLTAAVITKDSGKAVYEIVQVRNRVTAGPATVRESKQIPEKKAKRQRKSLQETLREVPPSVIREKRIEEHSVWAYNFTREAFTDGLWDENVVRARGLFISDDGKVVQRGYDKFFNIGERPETDLEKIVAEFGSEGAVLVKKKHNGFLGLVSTQGTGELRCYTKAGPTKFSEEIYTMLENHFTPQGLKKFTEWLDAKRVTLAFEVIHAEDPHIAPEAHGLVLLDAIANHENMVLLDKVTAEAAEKFHFQTPRGLTVVGEEAVRQAIADAYADAGEGAVLRHVPSGKMVKVKSTSYSEWKSLRGALNRAIDEDGHLHLADVVARNDIQAGLLAEIRHRVGNRIDDFVIEDLMGNYALDVPTLRVTLASFVK